MKGYNSTCYALSGNNVTYSALCVTKKPEKYTNFVVVYVFNIYLKIITMGNLLYVIAVILVIAWLVGLVGFHAGGIIHVLLVIAVIAVILRLISGRGV